MSAAVVIDSLRKEFGSTVAVDHLSLTVERGEIYGLLGPNGAGKTTTLRILAGILTPSAGRALIDGIDVGADPRTVQTRVGFLTGTTGLYARLTARELLTYFGRLHGMPTGNVNRRIAILSDTLDLGAILDRRCEALSTGLRQRVSVARAVLHDPPVLILDEPTVGLDVLASRFLRDFVRAERERGKAVIFSTHYLAEAELLCDRIGLIYRGRMLKEGTPAVLRAAAGNASSLEEAFLRFVETLERPAPPDADGHPLAPAPAPESPPTAAS